MSLPIKIAIFLLLSPFQHNLLKGQSTTQEDYEVYSRILSELYQEGLSERKEKLILESVKVGNTGSKICHELRVTADSLLHERQPTVYFINMYHWLVDTTGQKTTANTVLIDLVCQLESSEVKANDQLQDHFSSNLPIKVVSEEKLQVLFDRDSGGGWHKFYKRYRKAYGIIRLSNIMYSSDGQKGLLYYSISSGGLNGAGYYVLFDLGRPDNIIETQILLWIS